MSDPDKRGLIATAAQYAANKVIGLDERASKKEKDDWNWRGFLVGAGCTATILSPAVLTAIGIGGGIGMYLDSMLEDYTDMGTKEERKTDPAKRYRRNKLIGKTVGLAGLAWVASVGYGGYEGWKYFNDIDIEGIVVEERDYNGKGFSVRYSMDLLEEIYPTSICTDGYKRCVPPEKFDKVLNAELNSLEERVTAEAKKVEKANN